MAVWPGTLPNLQLAPLSATRLDNRIQSAMDAGPPKVRRRYTGTVKICQCYIQLNGAELAIFWEFWKTTLGDGALPFDWEDPETDDTVSCEIVNMPAFNEWAGSTANDRRWDGQLELRIA